MGDNLYGEVMSSKGRSEPVFSDNDKMDRNEGTLTYIEAESSQSNSNDIKYRDLYVQGQDVYYDLPRYLNY